MSHSGTDWIFSEHALFSLWQDLFANSSFWHLVGWLSTIWYDFNEKVETIGSNNSPLLPSRPVLTKGILVEEKCQKGARVYSLLKEFCFRKKYCTVISQSTKVSPEIQRACLVHPRYPSGAGFASCIILTPFSNLAVCVTGAQTCAVWWWQTQVPGWGMWPMGTQEMWPVKSSASCHGTAAQGEDI